VAGQNALVLQTTEPREFLGLYRRLWANPFEARALRRAGQSTARRYAWPEVLERVFLPRVDLDHETTSAGDAWAPLANSALRGDRPQRRAHQGAPGQLAERNLHPPRPAPVMVRVDSRKVHGLGFAD
jgi:hypothetical protein